MMEKNPRCKKCRSAHTIKKSSRNGKKRYLCKDCNHWFSIDHRKKESSALVDHLDGKAFRKIANREVCSKSTVERQVRAELQSLPDNNMLTLEYCDRFCGILVVDGKYVKVNGYEKKILLLWGIDYLPHDIPVSIFARGESYEAWLNYFGWLKRIDTRYRLSFVMTMRIFVVLPHTCFQM